MNHDSGFEQDPCEVIRPLLSLFADKEATTDETGQVTRHLAHCERCSSELAFLNAMRTAWVNSPVERSSTALFERIAHETYARPTVLDQIRRFFAPTPTRAAIGAFAVLGIVGVVTIRHFGEVTPSVPNEIAAEMSGGPVRTVPQTMPDAIVSTQQDNTARTAKVEIPPTTPTKKVTAAPIPKSPLTPAGRQTIANNATVSVKPPTVPASVVTVKSTAPVVSKAAVTAEPTTAVRQIARANSAPILTRHNVNPAPIVLEPRVAAVEPSPVPTVPVEHTGERKLVARTELPDTTPSEEIAYTAPVERPRPATAAFTLGGSGTGVRKDDAMAGFRAALGNVPERATMVTLVSAPTSGGK